MRRKCVKTVKHILTQESWELKLRTIRYSDIIAATAVFPVPTLYKVYSPRNVVPRHFDLWYSPTSAVFTSPKTDDFGPGTANSGAVVSEVIVVPLKAKSSQ